MLLRRTLGLLAVTSIWLTSGCSNNDPEALLHETLAAMAQAIEERNIKGFMNHISDDYLDSQSRTKTDIHNIARLHVLANRRLHVYRHIAQISVKDQQSAELVLLLALAGQPIDSADSLKNIRADLMRFQVYFAFTGKWQVLSAEWAQAGISDFF